MKFFALLSLFFAFVAAASALPSQNVGLFKKLPVLADIGQKVDIQVPQQYELQGNIFQVAEYVAYQFSQAQKLGYTGEQVSNYLVEQGFPQVVAEYLAQQYEAGLDQTYFQTPYQMFNYYYNSGVSQEAQKYLAEQIALAYQLYINYLAQYGEGAYQQQYPGVPQTISQYVLQQGKYYNQNGVSYSTVQYSSAQLLQAKQYAQIALQYFAKGQVQQQAYQSVYEQLAKAVELVEKIQTLPVSYQTKQQFIPYYAAQYYSQFVLQVYQYLQNAYQSTVSQSQVFPQYFVQQVQFAYLAAHKAYQTYQFKQSNSGFQGTFNTNLAAINSNQFYGSNQISGNTGTFQVVQAAKSLVQYVQELTAQGVVSQEFAYYFIEQLKSVGVYPGQYQQLMLTFENLYHYVQNSSVPVQVMQYLKLQIQSVLQTLQRYQFQPQAQYSPVQGLIQSYFNKNYQYPSSQSQYQYGPYSTYANARPYSLPSYQYGLYGPQNLPYKSTVGSYVPFQFQGNYPYVY
ncbi:hypothetical protein HUJ04_009895 [Dendroctonus ponderosae]|nr:hypothetical protein HUJ04_009895 [Dendroctonus ponderosae]